MRSGERDLYALSGKFLRQRIVTVIPDASSVPTQLRNCSVGPRFRR